MLSKGKSIAIAIILFITITLAGVYIFVSCLNKAPEKPQEEESSIKITRGTEIEADTKQNVSSSNMVTPSKTEISVEETSFDVTKIDLNDTETDRAVLDVDGLILDAQSRLKEETLDDNWYYGKLNVSQDSTDMVVVFEYENESVTPNEMYLYSPLTDTFTSADYMNFDLTGEIHWNMDVLREGTYAVFVNADEATQNIGHYTCYVLSKEDYTNLHKYYGMLEADED